MHLVLGQFEFPGAHVFVGEELDLFETYHLRSNEHVAMRASCGSGNSLFFGDFEYANLGVANRVREVIHINRFYIGFAFVEIQMLDVVLLPLMDVDRLRMDGGERGGEIDFADHFRVASGFSRRVDDDEVV